MQFGMPTLIENQTLQENVALCSSLALESSCKNREKERKYAVGSSSEQDDDTAYGYYNHLYAFGSAA